MAEPLDVVCVGETLVDFLPERAGQRFSDVERWLPCLGGSPANIAVGISRLGGRAAMLGVVGNDEFGGFLRERLAAEGVDISHLRQTDEGKTGLVFISLSETGERSFSYHRTRSAELLMDGRDVDLDFVSKARAVHLGTNSLLFPDAQRATLELVRAARAAGRILCTDPNLRLHMWPDPGELKALLDELLPACAIVKLSEDEIDFATGQREPEAALASLAAKGIPLPVVTLGPAGAVFRWKERVYRVPAPAARVVDTTGAGDGFTAGLLYGVTQRYPDHQALLRATADELLELATFGCRIGSKVVEKLGAVAGLPRRAEVEDLLPTALRVRDIRV